MCARMLFRVDAGGLFGVGHLMRCLSIAQEWQQQGGKCGFLLYHSAEQLNERITGAGYDLITLSTDDPSAVASACLQYAAELLVVDGYHFSSEYRRSLQQSNIPVVLVDDSIVEPPWCTDFIINPQPYAAACDYAGMPEERLLLGLEYLPIRREFRQQYDLGILPLHERRHILLNFGGTDPARLTLAVTKRLVTDLPEKTHLDIIISKDHVDFSAVTQISMSMPNVIHVHSDVSNMAELMGQAGLALSAAGSTLWELASLQVPVVAMMVAENQRVVSRYPYWLGLFDAIGGCSEQRVDDVVKRVVHLWQDETLRQEYATKLANIKLRAGSANICSRLCRYLRDEV